MACNKPLAEPDNKRTVHTSVSGKVIHKYYKSPLAGIMVKAFSHHKEPKDFFTYDIIEELDSAITDANGYYSMEFYHTDNAGNYYANDYYVNCPYQHIAEGKKIIANQDNPNTDVEAYNRAILVADYTIINNLHPPLEIIPGWTANVKVYGTDTILNGNVEADYDYFTVYRYYDSSGERHDKMEKYTTEYYSDTIYHHFYIDASSF